MTTTATELMNSREFWKTRMAQQEQYMLNFNWSGRDAQHAQQTFDSAFAIFEMCQFYYMSCYVLEELSEVCEPAEVQRIFRIHLEHWKDMSGKIVIYDLC